MDYNEIERFIRELISHPRETEWIEFKKNYAEPKEIGEYISALSNSAFLCEKHKAYLVFGVDDVTHEIVGTKINLKEKKVGNEELENWIAQKLEPRIDFKIINTNIDKNFISLIAIDSARNHPTKFNRISYIRVGTYKRKLSDFPEKEKKIWTKSDKYIFETDLCCENLPAEKVLEFVDSKSYFKLMNYRLPNDNDVILNQLSEDKIIKKSKNRYNITNMGGILFAANIKKIDSISRKAIRVIIYKNNDRQHTVRERVGSKGYAVGFEVLIKYLIDQLPSSEILGDVFQKEVGMYPAIAIRELVANALIHQDFTIKGTGPMIEIFKNRVEITNPGNPLIDTLRFIDHPPVSRNEKISSYMHRMGICEERGSGIDKVIIAIELHQLPAPNFIAGEDFFKVILYKSKKLRQMDRNDKIRACYQHCVLKYVNNEMMTNSTLRERFQIEEKNYPQASRIIADTLKDELIKEYNPKSSSRKYAKYIPIWA